MVLKDCTAERDCKFLLKILSRLYKIVKSCGPLKCLPMSDDHILGHYLLDSCFSSENFQDGMRAGGSLPLPIIHILSFYYQNLVK